MQNVMESLSLNYDYLSILSSVRKHSIRFMEYGLSVRWLSGSRGDSFHCGERSESEVPKYSWCVCGVAWYVSGRLRFSAAGAAPLLTAYTSSFALLSDSAAKTTVSPPARQSTILSALRRFHILREVHNLGLA